MNIIRHLLSWLHPEPVRLAIVRRYQDANGSYVGELYLEVEDKLLTGYAMIGASLDTLPEHADGLDAFRLSEFGWTLDTRNDFLAPMMPGVIRVGAMTPDQNDSVKRRVVGLPRRRLLFTVQTRLMHELIDAPKETR